MLICWQYAISFRRLCGNNQSLRYSLLTPERISVCHISGQVLWFRWITSYPKKTAVNCHCGSRGNFPNSMHALQSLFLCSITVCPKLTNLQTRIIYHHIYQKIGTKQTRIIYHHIYQKIGTKFPFNI